MFAYLNNQHHLLSQSLIELVSVADLSHNQEALTSTSKDGAARTSTCTGSTSTATSLWSGRLPEACSTYGMRNTALTSCRRTSTACACSPRPWTRPRTASWGCSSSGKRSKLTFGNRNGRVQTSRKHKDWRMADLKWRRIEFLNWFQLNWNLDVLFCQLSIKGESVNILYSDSESI